MKLTGLTAALLLAAQVSQVQAAAEPAFGPHFGISYVYAILSTTVHDLIEFVEKQKFGNGKMVYYARTGISGIGNNNVPVSSGGSVGTSGPVPSFSVYDDMGVAIGGLFAGNLDRVGNGQYKDFAVGVNNNYNHKSLLIYASDNHNTGGPDPICLASIAIAPDPNSVSSSYGIPAEVIVSMDDSVPWSYSGYETIENTPSNSCRSVKIAGTCVWFSAWLTDEYTPVLSVAFKNIPDLMARSKEPAPRLPESADIEIKRTSKAPPKRRKRDLSRPDPSSSRNNYALSGYQSAKVLCGARGSVGPSFFSTDENLYCDMTSKTLYSPCSSTTGGESCFRVTNGTVSLIHDAFGIHKRSSSEFSSLRLVSLNAEEKQAPVSRLSKRADCTEGKKVPFLKAGQYLEMRDFLQDEGVWRMSTLNSGDIIVYDATKNENPATIAVWSMGASSTPGLYRAQLKTNGQLCSRHDTGDQKLNRCVGPKGAEGLPYRLTITTAGYLYIKNGAQVVWTTDPRITAPPQDIDDYVLTKTNSFKSLDSINPGTLFKSTDGSTKMEYSKVGSLCIYNKLGYNT
ncbi:hypothetical protein BGX23_001984 [Mortierella sp. AD031]|nr:hypothetical protein BGX23_001984 [Mortierella sp. AD031]